MCLCSVIVSGTTVEKQQLQDAADEIREGFYQLIMSVLERTKLH
jgi:hypothetical protein